MTIGGDVNVSGIGAADINVTGDKISTRNLTVSQAAGHYTAQGSLPGGSGASFSFGGYFHNGLFPLQQGTLDGGMALVSLQARGLSPCSCSNASFAQNVTVNGNITVAAVGDGLVQLAGSTVSVTGSISGTATRATVVNGKSQYTYTDSSSKTWNVAHTLSGSGGRMEVDIRGKQPAGGNSDNNYSGTATLGGNVTLTGPNVDFEVKSGNVTVHDVTATGSGENLSVQDVYTPAGTTGTAFTFARSGTLTANVIELSAASGTGQVTAGALSVQGPLFAAIHVSAGTVTVGNLGVLASSDTVTLLDTRISTTPLTFSAGDAAIAISTVSSAGTNVTFGAATINGNITLQAARDAHLLLDGNVSGNLEVTAGRNIDNTLPTSIQRFLNDDVHSGASSSSANLPALNLSASALDLNAVGDVNLSGGNISVGAGVSSVTGDHALTNALGLGSLDPSLFISAGGTLSLPTVNFTGNYALIEANSITQFASVTAQPGSLVQLTPLDNTRTVGINAIGGGGQQTEFTGADLSLFNVGTLAIGSSTLTGTMTVGANGAVNLGSTNLVLADQTAIQGSGALSAAALTLLEGATTDVNLITNTGVISVGTGHDISIDNSAYTTGITTFTLATTPYNSVSLLAGGGMSITGLLTAASITASGGAGAVNLLTDTAALNIASGTDVVLDNSAETAATVLTFGAGTLGNVSAIFGGTATLGSGLNATSLILSAPGALDLGTGNLVLSGAATLIGAGITGTGLLTAGSITAGGGIGAVNLKTETTALIVASGTDITLDNSAETGAAFVGFASGSYGNVALNFSGDGVLGTNLNAGEFAMVSNNGSLDLSGQALALTTSLQLIAKQDIILTGVGIVVPIMTAVAGGDIHDGGTTGSISVDGLTMTATGNILMPLTQFNLGGGVVPGVNGDAGLLAVLSPLGLAPTSSNPNALLVAGGQLQLGGINFTGSYLYMQAAGVNVLGPVTTAPGALIQFAPPAVGDAVGIENLPATTADINLSNQQFLGQFPAVTLAIGNSDQSGNVDIGANGTIVLPDGTNFLVLTTGTVTGLENISSTGLVKNLLGTLTYTPTTGDIDPSASSTSSNTTSSDDDKKKKESDTEDTGTQQSSDTTAVTHDDSPASVCHG